MSEPYNNPRSHFSVPTMTPEPQSNDAPRRHLGDELRATIADPTAPKSWNQLFDELLLTKDQRDAALAQADAMCKERDAAVLCQAAIQQAFDELSDALRQRCAELEQALVVCITGLERAQLWIDVESATYSCTCGTYEHCPYCTKGTAASGAVARALDAARAQPAPAAQQAKHEAATAASREAYDRAYNAPDAPTP